MGDNNFKSNIRSIVIEIYLILSPASFVRLFKLNKMQNENLEKIGLEVDRIDNLLAGYVLPLGDKFHLEQTKPILTEISLNIKKALLDETGDDTWGLNEI